MKCDSLSAGARRLGPLPFAIPFVLLGVGCGQATGGGGSDPNGGSSNGASSSGPNRNGGGNGASSSGDTTATGGASSGGSGSGGAGRGASSGGSGSGASSGGSSSGASDDGGGVGSSSGGGADSGSSSCLDGITDYENPGPFKYTATASGSVKIWVPTVPKGCKVPVIHLANGTGATCANYADALVRMATHGFLTTCYEDANTGAGTQGITAFDTAMMMYPDLADNKLGSTGHSQGGQAAFVVLQLAEAKYGSKISAYAGLAMEPASGFGTQPAGGTWQSIYGKIKSPMFMFSGTADMLVPESWVQQAYSAMNPMNEVYWWSATGATHIPTPQVPEEQVSIPWFRWKLLGDNAACKYFKTIPTGVTMPAWTKRMSENEAPCK